MREFFVGMAWGAWMTLAWIARMLFVAGQWITAQIGQIVLAALLGFRAWARRTFFGNWRRTMASSAVLSLVAVSYFPTTESTIAALWSIVICLLGILVMFSPYASIFGGGNRRRRRQ